MSEIVVVKRGERVLEAKLGRSTKGLRIQAKAHGSIEDLFKSWGSGSREAVSDYGRHWSSPDGVILQAWSIRPDVADQTFRSPSGTYQLNALGRAVVSAEGELNMSFLRLVGISEGAGLRIDVTGVFSYQELIALQQKIHDAARQFYVDYLLPVDLTIVMSTEEIRR